MPKTSDRGASSGGTVNNEYDFTSSLGFITNNGTGPGAAFIGPGYAQCLIMAGSPPQSFDLVAGLNAPRIERNIASEVDCSNYEAWIHFGPCMFDINGKMFFYHRNAANTILHGIGDVANNGLAEAENLVTGVAYRGPTGPLVLTGSNITWLGLRVNGTLLTTMYANDFSGAAFPSQSDIKIYSSYDVTATLPVNGDSAPNIVGFAAATYTAPNAVNQSLIVDRMVIRGMPA